MKILVLKPEGWSCSLDECPSGLFLYNDNVCFKTEYHTTDGLVEAYCESGEVFVGGVSSKERDNLIVQPLVSEWDEE